ncbi:hypothetical protein F5883DRAFT_139512 [Diaporthe sp. PMI_573]|nr:hypothetical protein F5883DRAFT_139512 [Diaporthaceae sp. PMI_573]
MSEIMLQIPLSSSSLVKRATAAPPPSVLCRICERQIPPWWLEKHTDLCLPEHQAELEVQTAQESLTEHRRAIVKVLDALEARKSRSVTGDQAPLPRAEYKDLPIGPPTTSASSSSTSASPSPATGRSRDRSSGFGHAKGRSFTIRRPPVRIVELLLDLCDTALEISPPAIKEASSQTPGEFRTQSPKSESRMLQVKQWESPSTKTQEQEQGLVLLCSDTERVAKAKVEAVFRHRKIIEDAERIRIKFAVIVQEYIDEAMRKAAKIAAGRLSDSTEDGEEAEEIEDQTSSPSGATSDYPDRPHDAPSRLSHERREMLRRQEQDDKFLRTKKPAYVEHHDESDDDYLSSKKKSTIPSSSSRKHDSPRRDKSSRQVGPSREKQRPTKKFHDILKAAGDYIDKVRSKRSVSGPSDPFKLHKEKAPISLISGRTPDRRFSATNLRSPAEPFSPRPPSRRSSFQSLRSYTWSNSGSYGGTRAKRTIVVWKCQSIVCEGRTGANPHKDSGCCTWSGTRPDKKKCVSPVLLYC